MGKLDDFYDWLHYWDQSDEERRKFTFRLFFNACYRTFRSWTPVFKLRMFIQKLFRRDHLSDSEIWETGTHLSRDILRRLKAFKRLERMGYPSTFSEFDEHCGYTEEEYNKLKEAGEIIGGGNEKWEEYLDRMIMAVEYNAYIRDEYASKRSIEWHHKYFGLDPHEKTVVNANHRWIHKDKWDKDGFNFNGARIEPNDSENYIKNTHFANYELLKYVEDVVDENLRLFGKFLPALWD